MKISFIIPAYNEENYIGDCLDSLVKEIDRTGPSVVSEIIVVDNGSTDRTRLIAESSPGVRVVDEKVKSSGNARQRGFLNAQGEIVAFLDADTHIPSGWIQTMLDSFSKDSKVVAVSGPYVYFDLSPFWKAISLPYEIIVGTAAHFLTGHCVAGGNFAIQRKALSAIGGFDTSLVRYGSDLDAARRLQDREGRLQ